MKPFTTLAVVIFAAIAAIHLYRLVDPFEVEIGGTLLPQWVSVAGAAVAATLAAMLRRESRR